MPAFRDFLDELAYPYTPEADNPAYRFFLANVRIVRVVRMLESFSFVNESNDSKGPNGPNGPNDHA